MKKIVQFIGIVILLVSGTMGRVQAQEAKKMMIVTSFYPMYSMTSAVVGGLHDVYMVNSGNGIHDFEPSASDVAAIYDADLFVYHSSILESWTKNLEANKGNAKVTLLEASQGLDLLPIPGLDQENLAEGQNQENAYDPHSWLDPILAGQEVEKIAQALAEKDPANADTYLKNAENFQNEAKALDEQYQEVFKQKKNKTFVTQHTAFYYLAERFGLKQFGITGISSDAEPSAKQLNEVIQYVKEEGVKSIFVEPNISDKISQVIAQATQVKVVEVSPLESDPGNDESFLNNLAQQLKILSDNME